ncbi:hypothetical protein ACOSP7_020788 [Xanthoceras sorbifolium]
MVSGELEEGHGRILGAEQEHNNVTGNSCEVSSENALFVFSAAAQTPTVSYDSLSREAGSLVAVEWGDGSVWLGYG